MFAESVTTGECGNGEGQQWSGGGKAEGSQEERVETLNLSRDSGAGREMHNCTKSSLRTVWWNISTTHHLPYETSKKAWFLCTVYLIETFLTLYWKNKEQLTTVEGFESLYKLHIFI